MSNQEIDKFLDEIDARLDLAVPDDAPQDFAFPRVML